MERVLAFISCACLLALPACGDDDGTSIDRGDASPDATTPDAGALPDTGPAGDAGSPVPDDVCARLDLPRDGFDADADGLVFGEPAGDFTVTELDGSTWNLREEWTGCESYVFLIYFPSTYGDALFSTVPEPLVDRSPENAHFFLTSYEESEADRRATMERMSAALEEGFDFLEWTDEQREAARERVHFVVDRVDQIEGSVGPFVTDYIEYMQDSDNRVDLGDRGLIRPPAPFVFGIDREQRWDAGGSLDEFVGGEPRLSMAAYLPHFYDHRAALRHRLEGEEGVEEIVVLDEDVTDRVLTREVTLPDAETMATFDTLEIDVAVNCPHRSPFACSEWDRIARIELCLDEGCEERRELVRWITPYWRRGLRRWALDASPLLGLLREGGAQTLRVVMGPEWERATERHARVALRLSERGGPRAIGAALAFRGGNLDASYNEREPFAFTPPEGATRVELVTILSGHGQAEGTNCAEWCDHRHRFRVDGTDLEEIASGPGIGSARGCAELAAEGVPPGQWGNWAPQRAYWCPGLPVTPQRVDITDHVTPGSESTLEYAARYRTEPPDGAGGNVDLSAYVVWYE